MAQKNETEKKGLFVRKNPLDVIFCLSCSGFNCKLFRSLNAGCIYIQPTVIFSLSFILDLSILLNWQFINPRSHFMYDVCVYVCWLAGKQMLLFYVQEFPIGVFNQDSRLLSLAESNRERLSSRTRAGEVEARNIVRIISNKRR
jgi:hypothetical protein